MRTIQLLAILALVALGCDHSVEPQDICEDTMKTIRGEWGIPDEVSSDESDGDFFETWYYYAADGKEAATYYFRWGRTYGTSCFVQGNAAFDESPGRWQLAASAIEDGADAIRSLIDRSHQA